MPAMVSLPVGMLGSGDHACLSFANDAEQREVVTRFVGSGLAGKEKVYYFADTEPVAVADFLEAGGVAAGDAVVKGQLVVLGAAGAYLPGGSFDLEALILRLHQLIDAALGEGYAGLRVVGEMTWVLRHGLDGEAIASYEKAATTVFTSRPACGLCQYDRRRFPAGMLATAEAAHPQVATADPLYADASVMLIPVYDPVGLRVVGDIDLTNSEAWQSAVAAVADHGEEVRLDLSGLDFIDVHGVRVLARTAAAMAGGCRLVLDSAPQQLVRMLRLTGWDQTPNLVAGAKRWGDQ
jgi:anti-anti-sigma factor